MAVGLAVAAGASPGETRVSLVPVGLILTLGLVLVLGRVTVEGRVAGFLVAAGAAVEVLGRVVKEGRAAGLFVAAGSAVEVLGRVVEEGRVAGFFVGAGVGVAFMIGLRVSATPGSLGRGEAVILGRRATAVAPIGTNSTATIAEIPSVRSFMFSTSV